MANRTQDPTRNTQHTALSTSALLHALPVSALVLGLFYYWFAVADRYAVFLYGHLEATPLDEVTASRYWMSGLVASGAVMVVYTAGNWSLGRRAAWIGRAYCPPPWWQVWTLCAVPVAVGVPAITMTVNQPTLPLASALGCAAAALMGLAVALMPGGPAARRPAGLLWLALDGMGLVPCLLLLRAVELPGRGLAVTPAAAYSFAVGGILAGAVWLAVVTALRRWRRRGMPTTGSILAAGLAIAYLLLPLAHHLLFTPAQYRYISTSSNFFAYDPVLQAATFAAATILAAGATWLRRRVGGERGAPARA